MKKKIAVVIVFVAILVLPLLSWALVSPFYTPTLEENREKAPFPSFGNDMFAQFDAYFADRAPYRDTLIKLYNGVARKLGVAYENLLLKFGKTYYTEINNALFGQDDWLFYTGDDSITYYNGTNLPTEEELRVFVERAEKVDAYFKSQGKEFVIYVAPNKEQMYSEYMPRGIAVVNELRRLDVIYSYFKQHSDVKMVFPKAELLAAKSQHVTYYQQDTHWNHFGGWIGAQALFNALNMTIGEATISEIPFAGGDLATMAALSSLAHYNDYKVDYRSDVSINYKVSSTYEYEIESSNKNGKKLLLLGDSFRNAMREVLAKEYEYSIVNHRDTFNDGRMMREEFESATTVIFQSVERYDYTIFSDGGLLQRFINYYSL